MSVEITDGDRHESPQFEKLIEPLDEVNILAGDSAYLSRKNCDLVEQKGGTPFFKPKCNVRNRSHGSFAWRKMLTAYSEDKEAWLKRYHRRSLVESVFSAIKRRLGHWLFSVKKALQRKELLMKVIAYNLLKVVELRVKEEF